MNTPSKNTAIGVFFYSTAAIMVALGIAGSYSGSVRIGTLLIALSIALAGGTAVRLGHLRRW